MRAEIVDYVFRVFVCELAVSAVNYFVLMQRIYEPRWGELRAHRVGMTTGMLYIPVFAWALDHFAHLDTVGEYLFAGTCWLLMVLAFEWVGSCILRRPVHEILVGWHVERGYLLAVRAAHLPALTVSRGRAPRTRVA